MDISNISPQMLNNFNTRTKYHIGLVRRNLRKLAPTYGGILLKRAKNHDLSKWSEPERTPYIWLTEYHRCNNSNLPFEYPPGVEEKVKEASLHHIETNRHHPEYHDNIDDMNSVDIIEMVCDWTAMAQELGQNNGSALQWAKNNVGIKWAFNESQTKIIYEVINRLDRLNKQRVYR